MNWASHAVRGDNRPCMWISVPTRATPRLSYPYDWYFSRAGFPHCIILYIKIWANTIWFTIIGLPAQETTRRRTTLAHRRPVSRCYCEDQSSSQSCAAVLPLPL
ncbi:hypothetical protein BU23DRAFT_117043 [Bimuria novae-zelandiae CBS 107.79]|uniref:Uncharacterized protein n=1 Tax=Bimuria novae-zelandiae CBS 107.79 TaxID=1447943 RepID=A0A6A5VC73_9PLEO|nr:hypothetical protein BU23DRAFT_117043 [Bimuria novae-zelandiae CBS 107.79]